MSDNNFKHRRYVIKYRIKEIKIEDTDYTNINEAQLIAIRNNGEKIILDEGDYVEMKSSYYYLYDFIDVIKL